MENNLNYLIDHANLVVSHRIGKCVNLNDDLNLKTYTNIR